jgi:hypothetical protein
MRHSDREHLKRLASGAGALNRHCQAVAQFTRGFETMHRLETTTVLYAFQAETSMPKRFDD